MNSHQRQARRVRPALRYGYADNEPIGTMRIVDGSYHMFMNDGAIDLTHVAIKPERVSNGQNYKC